MILIYYQISKTNQVKSYLKQFSEYDEDEFYQRYINNDLKIEYMQDDKEISHAKDLVYDSLMKKSFQESQDGLDKVQYTKENVDRITNITNYGNYFKLTGSDQHPLSVIDKTSDLYEKLNVRKDDISMLDRLIRSSIYVLMQAYFIKSQYKVDSIAYVYENKSIYVAVYLIAFSDLNEEEISKVEELYKDIVIDVDLKDKEFYVKDIANKGAIANTLYDGLAKVIVESRDASYNEFDYIYCLVNYDVEHPTFEYYFVNDSKLYTYQDLNNQIQENFKNHVFNNVDNFTKWMVSTIKELSNQTIIYSKVKYDKANNKFSFENLFEGDPNTDQLIKVKNIWLSEIEHENNLVKDNDINNKVLS